MKMFVCECCGAKEARKENGFLICEYCGFQTADGSDNQEVVVREEISIQLLEENLKGTWTKEDEENYKRLRRLYWIVFFLGWCGVHRFYQKKIGTGILYLFTFGLLGIGWMVDAIKIALAWSKDIERKKGSAINKDAVLELVKAKNLKELDEIANEVHMIYYSRGVFGRDKDEVEIICRVLDVDEKSAQKAIDKIKHPYGQGANYNPPVSKQRCPKCGGENYHAFVTERVIREGKTKTTVSLNLNPLKPFTVFNQKEKVIREPWTVQESKFVCDDCGKIFK